MYVFDWDCWYHFVTLVFYGVDVAGGHPMAHCGRYRDHILWVHYPSLGHHNYFVPHWEHGFGRLGRKADEISN